MKKMSCLVAALTLCAGAALAQYNNNQNTQNNQNNTTTTNTTTTTTTTTNQNMNNNMGDWRANRHWDAADEAHYRIYCTLNAADTWAVRHELHMLPGSFEDLYYRAINRASDANGANWAGDRYAMN